MIHHCSFSFPASTSSAIPPPCDIELYIKLNGPTSEIASPPENQQVSTFHLIFFLPRQLKANRIRINYISCGFQGFKQCLFNLIFFFLNQFWISTRRSWLTIRCLAMEDLYLRRGCVVCICVLTYASARGLQDVFWKELLQQLSLSAMESPNIWLRPSTTWMWPPNPDPYLWPLIGQ